MMFWLYVDCFKPPCVCVVGCSHNLRVPIFFSLLLTLSLSLLLLSGSLSVDGVLVLSNNAILYVNRGSVTCLPVNNFARESCPTLEVSAIQNVCHCSFADAHRL